jgi:polysaccharide chain length determinant protein (PEP-CTERM system associated)
MLIMPVVVLAVGVLSPKQYETYTTILIQEAAKQNPFLQDLTVATNLKSRMEALNALLHSRHILQEVAINQGLINDDMTDRERAYALEILSKSIGSKLLGEDLIKITYRASNPDGMEELLKLVSMRFVERVIAPQRSAIFSSERFLEQELTERMKELAAAEQALAEYNSKYASELPNLHGGNVARLTEMKEMLAQRTVDLQGAEAARKSLKSRLSQTNPVIGRIEDAIVETLSELAIMSSRYTENHSKVQAAKRQLASLQEERAKVLSESRELNPEELERLWNLAASKTGNDGENGGQTLLVSQLERLQEAEAQYQRLKEEVRELQSEVGRITGRVTSFGEHDRRLNELNRNITVKRKIYEDLTERHQKAEITGALGRAEESERVKLIDPPFTPKAPSTMPLIMYLIAGIAGGIFGGIGLGVVAELLDTGVWRRDSLAKLVDAPVFTRIPGLPSDEVSIEALMNSEKQTDASVQRVS